MIDMDFEKIGKFIATLRKNKKLTQLQLAELTGASDKTISKWENGNSFPDLSYQSNLCKALEIELDELHAGELNIARRKRRKRRKLLYRLVIVYAAVTIPLIIFLCFFFVNNYDSTKIYKIKTQNSEVEVLVNGLLIETNKTNTLYIGNINLWNYVVNDTDIISVDIYSDDKLIFHSNELQNIVVKYDEEIKINKNNLDLKITITNTKNKESVFEVIIEAISLKTDNEIKTPRLSELNVLSEDQIIENLKTAGFKESNDNLVKTVVSKNKKENVMYLSLNDKLIYTSEDKTIYQNISYLINNNQLEVHIYNINEKDTIIFEKYTYDYNNKTLNCQVGVCSTLENVLKTLEPYVTLLTGES